MTSELAMKKTNPQALKSETPINELYRLIFEEKRSCLFCIAQMLGYSREYIKKILANEKSAIKK